MIRIKKDNNTYEGVRAINTGSLLASYMKLVDQEVYCGCQLTLEVPDNTTIEYNGDFPVLWGDGTYEASTTGHTYSKGGTYVFQTDFGGATTLTPEMISIFRPYCTALVIDGPIQEIAWGLTYPTVAGEKWSNLQSLTIGYTVTSIGQYAFANCEYLTRINLNARQLQLYSNSDNYIFDCAGSAADGITLVIGNAVTTLPDYLFRPYYVANDDRYPAISRIIFEPNSHCTYIGDGCFCYCRDLAFLNLPDSVTSIGYKAFYDCTGLVSVSLGRGLTTIGNSAFEGCYHLVEVCNNSSYSMSYSSGLQSTLYGSILYNCLHYYTDAEDTSHISLVDKFIFYETMGAARLVRCDVRRSRLYAVQLPKDYDGLEYMIDQHAFREHSALTSVDMTDCNISIIGDSAFNSCRKLDNVVIPGTVSDIMGYAFNGCRSLTNITIPEGVQAIGDHIFSHCASLREVVFPDSVTMLGNSLCDNCTSLTKLSIGKNVQILYPEVLVNIPNLEELTIPYVGRTLNNTQPGTTASEKNLLSYLFGTSTPNSASAYTRITQSYGEDSSNTYASYIPNSLKSLTVTKGNLRYGSLSYLTNVSTDFTVHLTNVDTIEEKAFMETSRLVTVILGNTTTIGLQAFYNSGLNMISIPDSVRTLGVQAFYNCKQLNTVFIQENALWQSTLPGYVFYGCTNLSSVNILGPSFNQINSHAFWQCAIRKLDLRANTNLNILNEFAFNTGRSTDICLNVIKLPSTITQIQASAFSNSTKGTYNVEYAGTMSAWKNIQKASNWRGSNMTVKVVCTDGALEYK